MIKIVIKLNVSYFVYIIYIYCIVFIILIINLIIILGIRYKLVGGRIDGLCLDYQY